MFKQICTSEDRPMSGRPRTDPSINIIKAVQQRVRRIPKDLQYKLKRHECDLNEKNHQKWSEAASLQNEKYTIPHTCLKAKKLLDRAKALLRYLKAGTAEQEIVLSDEKPFIIVASVNNQKDRVYAKSSAVIDESVRTVYRRKRRFHSWCGLQSSNLGSHLWFSSNRGLRSTQTSTLIIFWFQFLKRWKNISKIGLSPSNKMEHRYTPQ